MISRPRSDIFSSLFRADDLSPISRRFHANTSRHSCRRSSSLACKCETEDVHRVLVGAACRLLDSNRYKHIGDGLFIHYLVDVSLSLDPSPTSRPALRNLKKRLSILTISNMFYSPTGSFFLARLHGSCRFRVPSQQGLWATFRRSRGHVEGYENTRGGP